MSENKLPTWSERYGCHSLRIGPFLAQVFWGKTGYKAKFGESTLVSEFRDLETAKREALKLARRTLSSALSTIDSLKRWNQETGEWELPVGTGSEDL